MAHWDDWEGKEDPCSCSCPGGSGIAGACSRTAAMQSTVRPCVADTQADTFQRSCPWMRTLSSARSGGDDGDLQLPAAELDA